MSRYGLLASSGAVTTYKREPMNINTPEGRAAIGALVGVLGTAITYTLTTYTDLDSEVLAVWAGVYLAGYRAIEALLDSRRPARSPIDGPDV